MRYGIIQVDVFIILKVIFVEVDIVMQFPKHACRPLAHQGGERSQQSVLEEERDNGALVTWWLTAFS